MRHLPSRRLFLQRSLALAALAANGVPFGIERARAAGTITLPNRTLVNIMLNGGPDMRHLFMPAWSDVGGSYGNAFWRARASAQAVQDVTAQLAQRWTDAYFPAADGAVEFGILREAGWLHDMWNAGKVALMCATQSDPSRDHDLAIRVRETGNRLIDKLTFGNGWGGRLANAAGGNSVALTTSPRRFAFGPDPAHPDNLLVVDNHHMIPAGNMREIALAEADPGSDFYEMNDRLKRGLKNYYAARRGSVPNRSVFAQFFEHERKLRELGAVIDARLAANPSPAEIEAMFDDSRRIGFDLALQTRNLHDALVCNDLLAMRVASMDFNVWDSHNNQADEFATNAAALFGSQGALATLWSLLDASVRANLVFVIGGEFGRQLASNGGGGTDHGEGTTLIVVGDGVVGGVYGTMFPEEELARLADDSSEIIGLNGMDHIYGRVAEWVVPGAKAQVFPNFASAPLEAGLDLSGLLTA